MKETKFRDQGSGVRGPGRTGTGEQASRKAGERTRTKTQDPRTVFCDPFYVPCLNERGGKIKTEDFIIKLLYEQNRAILDKVPFDKILPESHSFSRPIFLYKLHERLKQLETDASSSKPETDKQKILIEMQRIKPLLINLYLF